MKIITINAIEADKPTCNNRIYPRAVMEKAVADFNEKIMDKKCFVLSNSPEGNEINLQNIGMQVTSCAMSGDKMMIEVCPMNTQACMDIEKLLGLGGEIIPNVTGTISGSNNIVTIEEVVSFSVTMNSIKSEYNK